MKNVIYTFFAQDEEFLYQEIGELFPGAHKSIEFGVACHNKVKGVLLELAKSFEGAFEREVVMTLVQQLQQSVNQHIAHQQEIIIPKMREKIPTQEREDLAEVLSEIKEELARTPWEERAAESVMI